MVLYIIYKDAKDLAINIDKLPEYTVSTLKLGDTRVALQGSEEMTVGKEEAKIEEEEGREERKKAECEDAIEMSPV